MLDVVHYFFEQDSRFVSAEEAEVVSALRSRIYSSLYDTVYRYPIKTSFSGQNQSFGDENSLKPYIPPTDFDADSPLPFGNVLDAPIG
jgi:hypothetical protein